MLTILHGELGKPNVVGEGRDTRLPGGTILTSKRSRQAHFTEATPRRVGSAVPTWDV